jgi:homeobox-leucine zipper protein
MHAVPNSDSSQKETRTFIRGIDVNRPPSTAEYGDEDAGVSSPNSTVSSSTGKRSEREEDTDPQGSRGISDDEDGDNSRKKLRLSKDQSAILEETFKDHSTLNPVIFFFFYLLFHPRKFGFTGKINGYDKLWKRKKNALMKYSH